MPVQEIEEPTPKKEELKENPERSGRRVVQEGDLKDLVKDRQESKDPTSKDSKVEIEDQRDVGRSHYRKHMALAKYGEQRQKIQDKSRKVRKFMKSFLKGHHFRKASALTFKPKLVKRKHCPLEKLWLRRG